MFVHVFLGETPPSGQPESVTDAGQVGESHERLEVLQQGAFEAQETDKRTHHLIDLTAESETRLNWKSPLSVFSFNRQGFQFSPFLLGRRSLG